MPGAEAVTMADAYRVMASHARYSAARRGTIARLVLCRGGRFPLLFFFNATATTEIYTAQYTLSLHDALPIWPSGSSSTCTISPTVPVAKMGGRPDRKSTRLNSSHIEPSRMPSSACKKKIPFTKHHWDSNFVAPHAALARDWERQLDIDVNVLFYYDFVFFFNDTSTTEIYTAQYTLSLHDALPI